MKQALIVVDYQNDFVDGALGFPKAKELEEPICQKIEQARKEGAEVIFTFDTHGGDYLSTQEGRKLPVPHCMKNSGGWQLYGRVAALKEEGDRCFDKPCFGSWELGEYAASGSLTRSSCAAWSPTSACSPMRCCSKRRCPEAQLVVDARCVASNDDKANEEALDMLQSVQVEVVGR